MFTVPKLRHRLGHSMSRSDGAQAFLSEKSTQRQKNTNAPEKTTQRTGTTRAIQHSLFSPGEDDKNTRTFRSLFQEIARSFTAFFSSSVLLFFCSFLPGDKLLLSFLADGSMATGERATFLLLVLHARHIAGLRGKPLCKSHSFLNL